MSAGPPSTRFRLARTFSARLTLFLQILLAVVRGPSVPKGVFDTTSVYSLADLGATVLHLAVAVSDYDNDGALVPITEQLREKVEAEGVKQHHLAEYWVEGVGEGKYGRELPRKLRRSSRHGSADPSSSLSFARFPPSYPHQTVIVDQRASRS